MAGIPTSGPREVSPSRAAFPFNFALGAVEAGHPPEIFLARTPPDKVVST
jgi:hypothetical protein